MILIHQPRLDPAHHLHKPLKPRRIRPLPPIRAGKLHIPPQPLQVAHLFDIAEVGLGGLCNSRNDLLPARSHGLRITGHLIKEPAGPGKRVIDLVNVRTQLGPAGSHAAVGMPGTNPTTDPLGLYQ